MAISQAKSRRKLTGARYKNYRKGKHYELGSEPSFTKLDKKRVQKKRILGGHIKYKTLSTDTVNLYDPKSKKFTQTKIKTITESPANRNFTRRNIMVKGSVIDTELGKAKITSRPGQEKFVNAVLIL
jgi:small subunit ribosomal protein S8e